MNTVISVLLSLLYPGLGQLYVRRRLRGILFISGGTDYYFYQYLYQWLFRPTVLWGVYLGACGCCDPCT